jgi:tetratricopeptide (TPR) repeat protein
MRYHLALTLLRSDRINDVQEHVDYLLSKEPEVPAYLNIKAAVLLKQNDPEKALTYLIKAIKIAPDTERTLLYTGIAKMMTENHTSADRYFNRLYQRFPFKPANLFFLIENSVRAGHIEKAAFYAENLISNFSVPDLLNALREDADMDLQWPIRTDLIAPVISQKISELSLMSQEIPGNGKQKNYLSTMISGKYHEKQTDQQKRVHSHRVDACGSHYRNFSGYCHPQFSVLSV